MRWQRSVTKQKLARTSLKNWHQMNTFEQRISSQWKLIIMEVSLSKREISSKVRKEIWNCMQHHKIIAQGKNRQASLSTTTTRTNFHNCLVTTTRETGTFWLQNYGWEERWKMVHHHPCREPNMEKKVIKRHPQQKLPASHFLHATVHAQNAKSEQHSKKL